MTEMNRPQRQSTFSPALAYGVLVLFFFAPHLLKLTAFPAGDFTDHFLPFSLFQQDALWSLRLPVWDPYTNSGHPFLADAQSAVFYPISNALLLLTGFDRSAVGRLYWLQVEAGFHLFLACAFTYMLTSRLTGHRMAAFASGLVFGFSGYLTGYPPLQLGILRTAIWLPLILLLLLPSDAAASDERVAGDRKQGHRHPTSPFRRAFSPWQRWLMAVAVHAIAFFAGHPQTFLFLSYAVGGWMLMLGAVELRRLKGMGREQSAIAYAGHALLFLCRVAAYIAALIVLTLGQLWPAFEFTQLSIRSSLRYEQLSGGFPLVDTWQMMLPGIVTQYSPQYVGIAGLGLALMAAAALFSSGFSLRAGSSLARPAALFFIICGVVALLLSYGANGPVYNIFYRFAPGGSLFRGQERAAYLVAFSLSALSGYGFALLPALSAARRRNLCWGFLAALAVGAALFLLFWQLPARVEVSRTEFLFLGGKSLLFAAAFAGLCSPRCASGIAAPSQQISRTRLILLISLLLVDLSLVSFTTNLANGPAIRGGLARPEAAATLQETQAAAAETASLPPRVYNEFRLPESSGQFVGWEDVYGASPLRLAKYDTLFQEFPLERMWELTGTGIALTWRRELFVESRVVDEFPQATDKTFLHRLSAFPPRVWWTQSLRSVEDKTALTLLADPNFNPRTEALIAASDAEKLGTEWVDGRLRFGSGGAAALQVERKGPAHLLVQVESEQPGLLFVSENWMPGWQATWNGQSRLPVVRAHQAFLGVPVPAGPGALELAYRPNSVRWGLAISGIGWVVLLFALRHQLILAVQRAWRRVRLCAKARWPFPSPASTKRGSHATTTQEEAAHLVGQSVLANRQVQRAGVLLALLVGFALRAPRSVRRRGHCSRISAG